MDADVAYKVVFTVIFLGFAWKIWLTCRRWRANPNYRFEEVLWHLGFALLVPTTYLLLRGPLWAAFTCLVTAVGLWVTAVAHEHLRYRREGKLY